MDCWLNLNSKTVAAESRVLETHTIERTRRFPGVADDLISLLSKLYFSANFHQMEMLKILKFKTKRRTEELNPIRLNVRLA